MEFNTFERRECPVCRSGEKITLFLTHDDRYGQPDSYTVLECRHCGACYLREAIPPEQIHILYEKYYGYVPTNTIPGNPKMARSSLLSRLLRRFRVVRAYDKWWKAWTAQRDLVWSIHRNERVLEIGCGYGGLAGSVQSRGAQWTGVEVDSNACQSVCSRGLVCLCGTIETLDLPEDAYDTIIGSQVIEHVSDPRSFMMHCARILRPGGRLLLQTPNANSRYRRTFGANWIHWFVPYHQVLFSPQSLNHLGRTYGFTMHRYWVETPTLWALLQIDYERPLRGERGNWHDKRTPGRLQPDTLSLCLRVQDALRGNGDNLIAELVKD